MLPDACALEAKDTSKRFGNRVAVDDVSFALPQGSFLVVFGPNGAGKTTLLRMMATLEAPTSGHIYVGGVDLCENPDEVRSNLGMVAHSSMLYPDLTAQENLALYGELYGVDDPSGRAKELLDAVGLKHRRTDKVCSLSRGMVQRVSIARALVHDPSVVLLDEPYSGLDSHAASIFEDLIADLGGSHTFCMVSHDFERGLALASHVLFMDRGRCAFFGEKGEPTADGLTELYRKCAGRGAA